jgi:hypothetical protein
MVEVELLELEVDSFLDHFESIIVEHLHPYMMKHILYDSYIDFHIGDVIAIEQYINNKYNTQLFIKFYQTDRKVNYSIKNTKQSVMLFY